MWLFALLILWPLSEIALYVTLGGWLGLWLSLAIVIGTAALGVLILRMQGPAAMAETRAALRRGGDPMRPLAAGMTGVLAGVLLILPGFLTDMAGLVLLLPPVQAGLARLISRRIAVRRGTYQRRADQGIDVIEGEWTETEQRPRPPGGGGSGWTRH